MDDKIRIFLEALGKRNIQGFYFVDKKEAAAKILEIIPLSASIGFSGSQTLEQIGIIPLLETRGSRVINQNKPGINREGSLELRKQSTLADFYLASANAVSEQGELVFFSAYGNRTSGVTYAKNTIIICGINKLAPDLGAALKRAREYSTPLNCKRLSWNTPCFKDGTCHEALCRFPEYKRMCCQVLIIEAEAIADRLKVIIVGESLGF